MATTFEVNIDVNSASLNELNKEFERLNTLAKELPANSKKFDQVAASAQKVGTAIEKTNTKLSGVKIDEKAELAVKAFRGLLGGVQAVSAAFIAFGADASAVEDAEKKLLGVLNVVQGIGDFAEGAVAINKLLGISFVETGVAAEGAAVGVNSFKTALVTSGIGALVLVLGVAVSYLLEFATASEDAADAQNKLSKEFEYNIGVLQNQADEISNQAELKRNDLNFDKKSAKERSQVRKDELKDLKANNSKQQAALTDYYIKQKALINSAYDDEEERKKQMLELDKEIAAEEKRLDAESRKLATDSQLEDKRLAQELYDIRQEQLANEIEAINANNATKRQLAEELATDEKQAAKIRRDNVIAANAEQLREELKAENLTATAISNIRAKYRNLDKLARIQYNKDIAQIDNDFYKAQNDLALAASNERFSRQISQLDFFYDEIRAQYKELNTEDISEVFFGIEKQAQVFDNLNEKIASSTEEITEFFKKLSPLERRGEAAKVFFQDFFDGLVSVYKEQATQAEKFAKSGRQGILDETNFLLEQNKKKAENTVIYLQQQQLAQNDYYEREKARLNESLKNGLITQQKYDEDLLKLQNDQEKSFDDFQERKKQVIENAAKNEVQITQNKNNKLEALDKQLLQISRNIEDAKLTQIEDTQKREEAQLKAFYDRQIADAEDNEELKLALAEEYLVKLALLRKKFGEEEIAERAAIAKQVLSLNQQLFNEFAQLESTKVQNDLDRELYALNKRTKARIEAAGDDAEAVDRIEKDSAEREDQLRKAAFENEKQRKLALAQINTAAAVLSILAETPKGDFGIATALLIAGAVATGALQTAAIRDTEYIPAYAEGGLVTGLGTNTSDSILARLSNGEFVVNAKSTQRYLPILNTLNETGTDSINQRVDYVTNPPIFKTYVLAGDVTDAQTAEARLNQKRKL